MTSLPCCLYYTTKPGVCIGPKVLNLRGQKYRDKAGSFWLELIGRRLLCNSRLLWYDLNIRIIGVLPSVNWRF